MKDLSFLKLIVLDVVTVMTSYIGPGGLTQHDMGKGPVHSNNQRPSRRQDVGRQEGTESRQKPMEGRASGEDSRRMSN